MAYRFGAHHLYVGDNRGYLKRVRPRAFRCGVLDGPYNRGLRYLDYDDGKPDADYRGRRRSPGKHPRAGDDWPLKATADPAPPQPGPPAAVRTVCTSPSVEALT
jgi:hypothetical protein